MTDDLDPSRLLASAALDDEVDAAERAHVESSPELLHDLETYRTIAAELRDVEVPAPGRDLAIAAALAAFDEVMVVAAATAAVASTAFPAAASPAAASPAAASPAVDVVSLQDRRRRRLLWTGRVAGGMAAAAVVAVIGVAALNSGTGDDKRSSSTVAVLEQSSATAAKSAPQADATLSSAAAAATETMPNIAAATGGASDATDPWLGAPSFTNPDELRTYALVASSSTVTADTAANPAAETPADTTAASTAAQAAPVPSPLATCLPNSPATVTAAFYAGQRVYLLRDEVAGLLRVLDPATCDEILTVPLP